MRKYFRLTVIILWIATGACVYWCALRLEGGEFVQVLSFFVVFTAFGLMTVYLIRHFRFRLESQEKPSVTDTQQLVQEHATLIQGMRGKLESIESPGNSPSAPPIETDEFVFLKVDGQIVKIRFADILYAEANRNSTRIFLESEKIETPMTFGSLESLLPRKDFIRLHRSFIVNKSRIHHISRNKVRIETFEVPIGANYREAFMKELGF